MITFTKKITVRNFKGLSFLFIRIFTVQGLVFFVSVIDEDHAIYTFSMHNVGRQWRILANPRLPGWILDIENELSDAIAENFKDSTDG